MAQMDADAALDFEAESETYAFRELATAQEAPEQDPDSRGPPIDLRSERAPPAEMQVRAAGPGGHATNTGPKGVKADFEDAKRNEASIKMREQVMAARATARSAQGDVKYMVADPLDQLKAKEKDKQLAKQKKKGSDSDSDSDLDDEDEEFLAKLRAERIKQIETVRGSMPLFGSYDKQTFDEFAAFVKSVHELTYVVCVLYEINHLPCARLHAALEDIASQFTHVRFVRVKSTEAIKGYSAAGIPTMLIYRGGKMVKDFIRVHDLFSAEITTAEVVRFLTAGKILQETTGGLLDAKPKSASKAQFETAGAKRS